MKIKAKEGDKRTRNYWTETPRHMDAAYNPAPVSKR